MRWTVVSKVERRLVHGLTALAVCSLAPMVYVAYHWEDSARFIDFERIRFVWFWQRPPVEYVTCWPLLVAEEILILLLGGGLLTWVVRRERRRKAAAG